MGCRVVISHHHHRPPPGPPERRCCQSRLRNKLKQREKGGHHHRGHMTPRGWERGCLIWDVNDGIQRHRPPPPRPHPASPILGPRSHGEEAGSMSSPEPQKRSLQRSICTTFGGFPRPVTMNKVSACRSPAATASQPTTPSSKSRRNVRRSHYPGAPCHLIFLATRLAGVSPDFWTTSYPVQGPGRGRVPHGKLDERPVRVEFPQPSFLGGG